MDAYDVKSSSNVFVSFFTEKRIVPPKSAPVRRLAAVRRALAQTLGKEGYLSAQNIFWRIHMVKVLSDAKAAELKAFVADKHPGAVCVAN